MTQRQLLTMAADEIMVANARIARLGAALGEIVARSELGSSWTKADLGQRAYMALERDGLQSDV